MGQGSVYHGAANGCNLNCCRCSGNVPPGNCSLIDGVATQFPQGTGWAATWNIDLTFRAGVAIADESMALNHHFPGKTVECAFATLVSPPATCHSLAGSHGQYVTARSCLSLLPTLGTRSRIPWLTRRADRTGASSVINIVRAGSEVALKFGVVDVRWAVGVVRDFFPM